MKFGFDWPRGFRERKMFEKCERRRRRTVEHGYTNGSGEPIIMIRKKEKKRIT